MTSLNRHGEDIPDPGGDAGSWGTILNSVLQFFDGRTWITRTTTSDDTPENYEFLLVDASNGDITITLPPVADDLNVVIKKISDSGNTVTIKTPNSETIDGQSTLTLSNPYVLEGVVSDGTDYYLAQ